MNYKLVKSTNGLEKYLKGHNLIGLDIETSPFDKYRKDEKAALDSNKSKIVGISISVESGTGIYIPLYHRDYKNANFDAVWTYIKENILLDKSKTVVIHNAAFESAFFYALGVVMKCKVYDTMAAAQLTLKTKTKFRKLSDSGLKKLVPELLKVELPSFESVTDGKYFDLLDPNSFETVRYACADADYALRLYHLFNKWFDDNLPKHRFIVEEIESPTAVYVGLMKHNGLLVDMGLLKEKQSEAVDMIKELKEDISLLTGNVNVGSNATTKEFKNFLFNKLELPVLKTTQKNKEAADDEAFVLLSSYCEENKPELIPLFEIIREYRKWGKFKSTYIDSYLKYLNPATGRIHPDLFPLGTETGRFASRYPNLQNCFDDKTEILTKRGFILFSQLNHDDKVAQWENGEIEFVEPTEIIVNDYKGKLICLKNQHTDLCLTPNHRCLLQNRKNRQYTVINAENYPPDYKQLHAGQHSFGNIELSPSQITLLCATQADGYYHDGGIDFVFSKARKYRRLITAINELKVPHSDYVKKNGQVCVRLLKSEFTDFIFNILGDKKVWNSQVLTFNRKTVKAIITELMHWDGCFTRGNCYSSSIKQNADWMQIIYILTGFRTNLREYKNDNPNSMINYQLDITERDYSLTTNIKKSFKDYDGKVYCVSVPSGFIVVRRNGKVCITGNCPRKDNDPIGVRNFFIAPKGKVLMSLDFSQIELRVRAFYCRDEAMMETFRGTPQNEQSEVLKGRRTSSEKSEILTDKSKRTICSLRGRGGDIHAKTTSVIYKIPFEQAVDKNAPYYKERRTIAKACNFGVFFGLFPNGLLRSLKFKAGLDVNLDECTEIIKNLKAGYPQLETWQRKVKVKAKFNEYTQTYLSRRRYLPNILSQDWNKKSFAERQALNTPIQGTAADILKLAIVRILRGLPERPWLRPLLQIHDELMFELPEKKLTEAVDFVKKCMETKPFKDFDMPLIAEAAVGKRFGSLKEV